MTMPNAVDLMTEAEVRKALHSALFKLQRRERTITSLATALSAVAQHFQAQAAKLSFEATPAHVALAKAIDRALSDAGV